VKKNEWSIRSNPVDNEWFDLNQINLIVGRNASGKTKTIYYRRHQIEITLNCRNETLPTGNALRYSLRTEMMSDAERHEKHSQTEFWNEKYRNILGSLLET